MNHIHIDFSFFFSFFWLFIEDEFFVLMYFIQIVDIIRFWFLFQVVNASEEDLLYHKATVFMIMLIHGVAWKLRVTHFSPISPVLYMAKINCLCPWKKQDCILRPAFSWKSTHKSNDNWVVLKYTPFQPELATIQLDHILLIAYYVWGTSVLINLEMVGTVMWVQIIIINLMHEHLENYKLCYLVTWSYVPRAIGIL